MMKIKMFDHVLLKSGSKAHIVEIFKDGVDYLADIDYDDDTETEPIKYDDIEAVIP